MKGSNIAVDVYSRLAIFHGQRATALFNTPLPATLGFLFNSKHLNFLGYVCHKAPGMSPSRRAAPSTLATPAEPTCPPAHREQLRPAREQPSAALCFR